jgi:hypothetical protein
MAAFTLAHDSRWVSGATITIYRDAQIPVSGGPPSGSAVTTATAGPSTTRLTGLEYATRYVAISGGKMTRFRTHASAISSASKMLPLQHLGTLAVGDGAVVYTMPFKGSIVAVSATVGTAPVGAAVIVDLKLNGSLMFTTTANRPTIAAGGTVSDEMTPDVTKFARGDQVRLYIAQTGSGGTEGQDLALQIYVTT